MQAVRARLDPEGHARLSMPGMPVGEVERKAGGQGKEISMIAGIIQTAFWIGAVLVVALVVGWFWVIVTAFLDTVMDVLRTRLVVRRSGSSWRRGSSAAGTQAAPVCGATSTPRRTPPAPGCPSLRGVVDETALPLVLVPRRRQLDLSVDSPWNPDGTRKVRVH